MVGEQAVDLHTAGMALALATPIADSERFIELVDPVLASPPLLRRAESGKTTPPRPTKSSARSQHAVTPSTLSEKLHAHNEARSVPIPLESSTDIEDGKEERFYSPLSTPAILPSETSPPSGEATIKQRNRTSEISVLPMNSNKESGVTRAFRSKIGTDGSISLSILPSAAVLSEMLQQNSDSQTDTSSTYQPSSTFSRSNTTLGIPPSDARRPSAASTKGSVNTRPLTIKRKKPAVYSPEEASLPISRAASIDACTPTSEDGGLGIRGSPRRKADLALPVTQTFQTPLRRIPQSDITPPSTPPAWRGSTHSDTHTEEDSLPVSPRNSGFRPSEIGSALQGRKSQNGGASMVGDELLPTPSRYSGDDTVPSSYGPKTTGATRNNVELDFLAPFACDLEEMQDRPGLLRRDSDDSTDMEDEEDDDDESVHDFGLDNFPVPSIFLSSAKNTPRMYPVSPTFVENLTSGPAERKASTASTMSRLRPKTDLYPIPTDAEGNQEWDQATELEIRDRVFRAEIKKPNKVDKMRRKALQKQFDQFKKPKKVELYEASLLSVRDENGHKVRFGHLFEEKRTIVCFIRHFWCGQCQNYVEAVTKVKPEVLAKFNMNLVIISNGSWKMIKSYRKLLGNACPYPIYTDRAKHVYTALGMTLRTWDAGKERDRGAYIQHSLGASAIASIKSGVKLPLRPPGDQQQLGGEFILGPGLKVEFCHRMKTTRGHAEIEEVLASVGINLEEETRLLSMLPRSEASTPSMMMFNNNHMNPMSASTKSNHHRQHSKRRSAVFMNGNGISSLPHAPSLAASIINRLHYGSPRMSSASSAASPPGSPVPDSTGGISGGIGNTADVNGSPGRRGSRRLQKTNRNLTGDLGSSVVISQFPLGISPALAREVQERAERTRPTSSSTLAEEEEEGELRGRPYSETLVAYERFIPEEDVEDGGWKMPAKDNTGVIDSVPPHIPTPTSTTPLDMGFLQVPTSTPPLFKGTNGTTGNNSDTDQRRRSSLSASVPHAPLDISNRQSTTVDEIYDDYLSVPNGGYVNGRKVRLEQGETGQLPVNGIYHSPSRFSESSTEADEGLNAASKSNERESKRASNISTLSWNSNGRKIFGKNLNLRRSNPSLKGSD